MLEQAEQPAMSSKPLVSVVIIFLNAEKFLQEAIESVIAQTYENWELLLVDDGSSDGSTDIARHYSTQRADKVTYLEHPGHANRGMSASRNLGIRRAHGKYIAFLDADDVWLAYKLEEQVSIMDAHPDVGMLYGETLYWYSWQRGGSGQPRDFRPVLGVSLDQPLSPLELLPLYLRGNAAVPCPCSILVRRSVMADIGGFAEEFSSIYEDQAFYAKVCLATSVIASGRCWDKYRQHPQSSMAAARRGGKEIESRSFFLEWLEGYMLHQDVRDIELWLALRRERWRIQNPTWLPPLSPLRAWARWVKKWLLTIEENALPEAVGRWLWGGKRRNE
jgi:glycosyltransferase involved in cell wall biosynthesis